MAEHGLLKIETSLSDSPKFATPSLSNVVTPNVSANASTAASPVPITPLTSPKVEFLKLSEGYSSLSNVNKQSADSSLHSISSSTPSPLLSQQRRSSSRSIKRPKFDDELVESGALKRSSSRKTSESSPSDVKPKKVKFVLLSLEKEFIKSIQFVIN